MDFFIVLRQNLPALTAVVDFTTTCLSAPNTVQGIFHRENVRSLKHLAVNLQ